MQTGVSETESLFCSEQIVPLVGDKPSQAKTEPVKDSEFVYKQLVLDIFEFKVWYAPFDITKVPVGPEHQVEPLNLKGKKGDAFSKKRSRHVKMVFDPEKTTPEIIEQVIKDAETKGHMFTAEHAAKALADSGYVREKISRRTYSSLSQSEKRQMNKNLGSPAKKSGC
jgi:hypothetical protein